MFNNSNKTDEGWSPDGIGKKPRAILNLKKRLLRAVGMLRMLKVLRAVGLLALFSALVMEFHREAPIAKEGVGGGGGGGIASIIIRGGSGGGGIATETLLRASAVTERNDAADYEEKSHEQTLGDVTGDKADDNDEEHSTYNDEEVKTDEHQQHASIVVPHSADESSQPVDFDDCDGCDETKVMPNADTAIDDNINILPPEPFKQPALISVGVAHPSKSTAPVEQIVLLGERHSGTELIADHLAKCFDVKVMFALDF